MITIGVDLAAEAAGTAMAVVRWGGDGASLDRVEVGVDDAMIVARCERARAGGIVDGALPEASTPVGSAGPQDAVKVGIDCPLGWPDDFVDFLSGHRALGSAAVRGDKAWRMQMAYRETDRVVRDVVGRWPLSVSTDRLGMTALRGAGLTGRLAAVGLDVDRAGRGDIAEVYPRGSLRTWGLWQHPYRLPGHREERAALLARLARAVPWLDLGPHREVLQRSADALDALVASLAMRAVAVGAVSTPVPMAHVDRAGREGWIMLPTAELDDLAPGSLSR